MSAAPPRSGTEEQAPERPIPVVNERNAPFWTSGARGVLAVQRCADCRHLIHPPALRCPHDHSPALEWEEVSGRGRVEAWTENLHTWFPGFPAPYLVALVTLDEDPSARLLTNLVGVATADVHNGMPVRVVFEHLQAEGVADVYLPLFTHADAG
jgi:uncharacterized OB-fold protein